MGTSHDLIIIGAGLAGSSAAIEAGRRGLSTLLVDNRTFPKDKVCGEGLSAQGVRELETLLGDRMATLPTRPFYGFHIQRGGTQVLLKQPLATGAAIARRSLDAALFDQARATPGVETLVVACPAPNRTDHLWRVFDGSTNFSAPFLFIADGAHSPTGRALGIAPSHGHRGRLGIRAFFQIHGATLPPYIRISLEKSCELYATPLTDTILNLTILAGTQEMQMALRRHGNSEGVLLRALDQLGLRGEMLAPPKGAGPVGTGRRAQLVSNALLIGDAAESLDPIGGMGMTHALRGGRLASEMLAHHLSTARPAREFSQSYESERDRMTAPLRGFTALVKHALPSLLALGPVGATIAKTSFPLVSSAITPRPQPSLSRHLLASVGRCCR